VSGWLVDSISVRGKEKLDSVVHPAHYTFGRFEVIDVLEDWFPKDPLLFNVGKYIARAAHKGRELEDLKKARFYLERRIAGLESKSEPCSEPHS